MQLFIQLFFHSSYSLRAVSTYRKDFYFKYFQYPWSKFLAWSNITWILTNSSSVFFFFLFTCSTPKGGTECEWEPNLRCRGGRLNFWVRFFCRRAQHSPRGHLVPPARPSRGWKIQIKLRKPCCHSGRDLRREGWRQWGGTKWHWKHKNFFSQWYWAITRLKWEKKKSVDNDEDRKIP